MNARPVCTRILALLASLLLAGTVAGAAEIEITFHLENATATSVGVAGDFSNWTILPMTTGDAGHWSTTLSLKPGVYGYKFVVNDSDWILDPANPRRKISNDIENSAVVVGDVPAEAVVSAEPIKVTFRFRDAQAQTVHVAGQFNDWLHNVAGKVTGQEEWLLHKGDDGGWLLEVPLRPGKYEFKYVIDGGERWENDPDRPQAENGNSLLEVKPAAVAEATVPVVFEFLAPDAQNVVVAGEFNNWNLTAHPLQRDESGKWQTTINLKPGRYAYKFVVDGQWQTDPANGETAPDGLGGENSVKTVAH